MLVTDEMAQLAVSATLVNPEAEPSATEIKRMRAALEAVAPMIRAAALDEAARFCEQNSMGMSVRLGGPLNGYSASPRGEYGSHSGDGYAAAIRALKDKEPT